MSLIDSILTYPNLIALLALLTSVVSITVGYWGLLIQQKHNRLSVKPLISFRIYLDRQNGRIEIKLKNDGIGPMVIKSIEFINDEGISKTQIRGWLPRDIVCLTSSSKTIENFPILPREDISLFEYDRIRFKEEEFRKLSDIESILKDLTIKVKYKDIYDIEQPVCSLKLTEFGDPFYPEIK